MRPPMQSAPSAPTLLQPSAASAFPTSTALQATSVLEAASPTGRAPTTFPPAPPPSGQQPLLPSTPPPPAATVGAAAVSTSSIAPAMASPTSVSSATEAQDNLILSSILQGGASAATSALTQAAGAALGQVSQSQRCDDTAMGSYMQHSRPLAHPSVAGPSISPQNSRDDGELKQYLQPPAGSGTTVGPKAGPQAAHDGSVLSQYIQPPVGPGSPVGAKPAPQVAHDDAVLRQYIQPPVGPAPPVGPKTGAQVANDDAILRGLLSQPEPRPAQLAGAQLNLPQQDTRDDNVVNQFLQRQALRDDTTMDLVLQRLDRGNRHANHDSMVASLAARQAKGLRHPTESRGRLLFEAHSPKLRGHAKASATPKHPVQPRCNTKVCRMPKRTKVRKTGMLENRDVIEERAAPDLAEDNHFLRKQQNEMRCRLQDLEAKLRNSRNSPMEKTGSEELSLAADVEQLQCMVTSTGKQKVQRPASTGGQPLGGQRPGVPAGGGQRGQRQRSQRRFAGVGRLRRRMNVMDPLGAELPPSPKDVSQTTYSAEKHVDSCQSPRVVEPVVPPLVFPATGMQRDPWPITAQRDPWPEQQPTQSMMRNMASSALIVGQAPPSGFDPFFGIEQSNDINPQEEADRKRLQDELHQQVRELDENLQMIFIQKQHSSDAALKHQHDARKLDEKIAWLEKNLAKEREQYQANVSRLQADLNRLQTELAVARANLHHMKVMVGSLPDVNPDRLKLEGLQNENAIATKQIRDLTVGAFCASSEHRVVSSQRLKELEEQIKRKTEDCDRMSADGRKVSAEREQAEKDSSALDQQCRGLIEDNERLSIRLEEKSGAARRAQAQLADVFENLEEGDRKVLTFSLQFLREHEVAKCSDKLLDAVAKGVPPTPAARAAAVAAAAVGGGSRCLVDSAGVPPSVEETTHLVDALRAKKDELAQELLALQAICQREKAINKDLRAMHRMDVDELGKTIEVTVADTVRCKRLASDREKRIEELQRELVRRRGLAETQPGLTRREAKAGDRAPSVVSDGGFTGLTELEGGRNALDFYVTVGRVEERALLEVPRQYSSGTEVLQETSMVTMVLTEFMHFDVGCSEEASGLRPRYDSLISFGPFEVSDPVLEHFARGAVRFELQAFAVGSAAAYTLGRASMPLAAMLDCTPQDPNPVVTGTLSFASESDARLQIATVQYKARWRRPILAALGLYATRLGLPSADAIAAAAAGGASAGGAVARAHGSLMDRMRTLIVHIRTVSDLRPLRMGAPPENLRPYVCYELPGHKQHFSRTMVGPVCRFEDTGHVVLRVDNEFCRWAERPPSEGGGMHFVVFDGAAPVQPEQPTEEQIGVLGEVRVPLGTLLTSPFARIQNNFPLVRTLRALDTVAVGLIDVEIWWQDDTTAVLRPGLGGPSVIEADHFGGMLLSDEQYQITWQRIIRRLGVLEMSPRAWFDKHDVDKDGFWTKPEAHAALLAMPLGLTTLEIEHIFDRMDAFKRGHVSFDRMLAAIAEGDKAGPLEQWARDVYRRIGGALTRLGQTLDQVLSAVCQNAQQVQKRDFFSMVTSLDLGLKPEQLELLWKLSDANCDGLLSCSEFSVRLQEAAAGGASTTAFPVPRPGADRQGTVTAAAPQPAPGPTDDVSIELCLVRILRACLELGWRTEDKVIQQLGVREDGLVSRAEFLGFCSRARARVSDEEVDQVCARLDTECRGAFEPRAFRVALLHCNISDSSAQVAAQRAVECMGLMRQGLMRRCAREVAFAAPGASAPSAVTRTSSDCGSTLRKVFEELSKEEPLCIRRQDLNSTVVQLGTDISQVQLDELWGFVGKTRNGSLDVDAFIVQLATAPLPGEGSVDDMTDQHFAILMGRLKRALERLGVGGAEKAFHSFRTGRDGCLSPAELEGALAKTVDNLSARERKLLVARIDTNGDGRISLAELEAALERAHVSALSLWAEDACLHVTAALRRAGKSVDELFTALAKGSSVVHWPDFEKLFSDFDPTLTKRQLQQLWQAFDKNGDGAVSRDEFVRALNSVDSFQTIGGNLQVASAAPMRVTDVLVSRIQRALGAGRLSIKDALRVYDTAAEGGLDLAQWIYACHSLRLPLSEAEARVLHASLAHGTLDKMPLAGIEAEIARVAARGVPEERWARSLVTSCALRAQEAGLPPADEVLSGTSQEAVQESALRAALSQSQSISDEQWSRLLPLLERRPADGLVLWRPFLGWASAPDKLLGTEGPVEGVIARINAALRRESWSSDVLFDSLAKGSSSVEWPGFEFLFLQLEPSLSSQQLRQLWLVFDKNGDGGVSREEFNRALGTPIGPHALDARVVTDICARVVAVLQREGKSVDGLFDALAQESSVVQWIEFETLFLKLEPTLTSRQLRLLWDTFDKNGDGGVSRDEFRRALVTPASVANVVEKATPGQNVCARITAALRREGRTVNALFDGLAKGSSVVHLSDFVDMLTALEPTLTNQELQELWTSFDKDGDGGVSRDEFQRGLDPEVAVAAVCTRVATALRREGKTIDTLFEALAKGSSVVQWPGFETLFMQLEPTLTSPQLQHLWQTFDKNRDGAVSRDEFWRALLVPDAASPTIVEQPLPPSHTFAAKQNQPQVGPEPPRPLPQPADAPVATNTQSAPLSASPHAPTQVTSGPAGIDELTDAIISAIVDVAALRGGSVRDQLLSFDKLQTGKLDAPAFSDAMISYCPGLSDAVISALWRRVGGGTDAGAVADLCIDDLAAKLVQPAIQPPASSTVSGQWSGLAGGELAAARADTNDSILWAVLRRVRLALHARALRLHAAFEAIVPQGMSTLPRGALAAGLTGLGCAVQDGELRALFVAMSNRPEEGATLDEFQAPFALLGAGFDEYAMELFGIVGQVLATRAGSLSSAFAALDHTASGCIGASSLRDVVLRYGDCNLSEPQLERLWQLVDVAGGARGSLDFDAFRRLCTPKLLGEPALPGDMVSRTALEEACVRLAGLGRTKQLRHAFEHATSESHVQYTMLVTTIRTVVPELTEAELEQICRLAPRRGGLLRGEDAYNYHELLVRFESGRADWHPIEAQDRVCAGEVCRYIAQSVVAARFQSFSQFVSQTMAPGALPPTALPAPVLLGLLQKWLPPTDENMRICELSLLRLGCLVQNGLVDLVEFYWRFEGLARGEAVAGVPAGAGIGFLDPGPLLDTAGSQEAKCAYFMEHECPVDLMSLSPHQKVGLLERLRRDGPTGAVAFDRLVLALEASEVRASLRQQGRLKRWLHPIGRLYHWPPLLAFAVTVERVAIVADRVTRQSFPQLRLEVSFCRHTVRLPGFRWKFGMMQLREPKTTTLTPQWHAMFSLDGPQQLPREDLACAVMLRPPPTHVVRIALSGFDCATSGAGGDEECEFGAVELSVLHDLPSRDGGGSHEHTIEWRVPAAGRGQRLLATVAISTRNARRLREALHS